MAIEIAINPTWDDLFDLHLPTLSLTDLGLLWRSNHLIRTRHIDRKTGKMQLRASGTPYYTHLVSSAILTLWINPNPDNPRKMAEEMSAALLHDIKEDCDGITDEFLRQTFSPEVAFLVDSLTREKDNPHDYSRKLLERTWVNPAVAEIKLAENSHNAVTLGDFSQSKQKAWCLKVAREYFPFFERATQFIPSDRRDRFSELFLQTAETVHRQLSTLGCDDPFALSKSV